MIARPASRRPAGKHRPGRDRHLQSTSRGAFNRPPSTTGVAMARFSTSANAWAPRALGLLRIVTAFLFIQHGTAKLFHVPHIAMMDGVQLMSLVGIAGVLEVVGGALLLL